jgi:hypothetical protein
LIKRLTPNITITYDGDTAGIKAALRGIDLILEEDMNVRVVLLPPEDDPDSYVKREGADGFLKYRNEHIQDFILFKAGFLQAESKKDPVKRAEAIKDIVDSIALIPDAIKRSVYVKECSQLLDMQEQILVSEVNKIRHQKHSKQAGAPREDNDRQVNEEAPEQEQVEIPSRLSALARQERDLVRLLLEYADYDFNEDWKVAHAILIELDADDTPMADPISEKIVSIYRTSIQDGIIPNTHEMVGCVLAEPLLQEFGYTPADIEAIKRMIMATEIPQNPLDQLSAILCDADLDYLGRPDFYAIAQTLKTEWINHQIMASEDEWEARQLTFLRGHRYFTPSGIQRREKQKQQYIRQLSQE